MLIFYYYVAICETIQMCAKEMRSFRNVYTKFLQIIYDIYVKKDMALNNQRCLIWHKTKPSYLS